MLAVKFDKTTEPAKKNIKENKKIILSFLNDSALDFKLKFKMLVNIIISNKLFSNDIRILDTEL